MASSSTLLKKKINTEEEKASGNSPDTSEEDQLVDELIEFFTTAAVDQQEAEKVKSDKKEVEMEKAKEDRQQSLETFGETRKIRAEEGKGREPTMKKKRLSVGKDTFAFLEKKMREDIEVKWKELDLKKQEIEEKARHRQFIEDQRKREGSAHSNGSTLEMRLSLIEQHLRQQNQIIVQLLQNLNQFTQMLTEG
eukprot:gene19330-21254_t